MLELKKIHCNTCNHETNHELLLSHTRSYEEEVEYLDRKELAWYERFDYRFLVCRGCDTATLEEKYNCDGMYNHSGDEIYSYSHFPERQNKSPRQPKKFVHIDSKLLSAYKEIIEAHNKGLEVITSMGVRALLEGICVVEGINDNEAYHLTGKIQVLQEKGSIPEGIIDGLNSLKFIGDDAAHRLSTANKQTISLSIDMLEALLTHLYEAKFDLKHKAELMKIASQGHVQNAKLK